LRAVRFKVSGTLLREALHMPATAHFAGATVGDFYRYPDTVEFVVVDDAIPQADELREVEPTVTKVEAVPEKYLWNWNIPTPSDQGDVATGG